MLDFKIFKETDWRKQAWVNGKGSTSEILIHPQNSKVQDLQFDWRLSTAPIVESGDFSEFPNYQRLLVIIEGMGIDITVDGKKSRVKTFEQLLFSGAAKSRADLLTPATICRDINFIFNPKKIRPQIEIMHCSGTVPLKVSAKKQCILVNLAGEVSIRGARLIDLSLLETLQSDVAPMDDYLNLQSKGCRLLRLEF